MSSILAEIVSCHASANRAEETALTFGHGRCVGVVVGRVLVAGLRGKFMSLAVWVVDLLWRHLTIRGLLGVLLKVFWRSAAEEEVSKVAYDHVLIIDRGNSLVAGVSLRITRVVLAILATCLSMLEAALLRRTEAISSCRRAQGLVVSLLRGILRRRLSAIVLVWRLLPVLVLRKLRGLIVLLGRIASLLRWVALTVAGLLVALIVALLTVLIVWT